MHTSYQEVITRLIRIETLLSDHFSENTSHQRENERLGGIELAIEITGLAKSTIYHLAAEGCIPYRMTGKKLYFSSTELTQWIKDGKHKTLQEMEAEILRHLSEQAQNGSSKNS